MSIVSVPVVFAGVFIESKVIRSEGLKEKTALEAATKVTLISNTKPSIQFS